MSDAPTPDLNHLQPWVGRQETRHERLAPTQAQALQATLDRDAAGLPLGEALPPLWHWAYFTPLTPAHEIGPDGHALRGGFLPPVPLPRRMWAGGRLHFHRDLRLGEMASKTSTIQDVTVKQGRTGTLVFVCVRHDLHQDGQLALSEEHDIVYRPAPQAGDVAPAPVAAPAQQDFQRDIVADPVLLFRYSALTFNGHRIHYDRRYVTEVEGYPGLIVHGPLIATWLVDLLERQRPGVRLRRFEFKAVRPAFDIHPLSVHGQWAVQGKVQGQGERVDLWARDHEGWLLMKAQAELA
jgi:3-methylfumaryl-CoA hydratase